MADYSIDSNIHGGPITADITTALAGLDDMQLTLAGGTTTTLAGENTLHTDAHVSLDPVNTTAVLELKPVSTTTSIDSSTRIDLAPLAVDSCVRVELAPLPATKVCTPYEQTWSWSILGFELFSLTVRGELTTHLRPDRVDPVVIDG
jgi:hypothetical protein